MAPRRNRTGLWIGLLLIALAGCEPSGLRTYPVNGTVTFADGQPVKFGTVEFYSEAHDLTARGKIQPDGTFQLGTFTADDGAVEGAHNVIIVQLLLGEVMGAQVDGHHDHGRHVDRKFSDYNTSDIKINVSSQETNAPRLILDP